jgi:uroporphyrinogen-III synthase
MRVIVTRPAEQAASWVQSLSRRGVDALALPLIQIAAPLNTNLVTNAWQQLAGTRLVAFVSANAVAHFFALRPAHCDWPSATLAASTGPGTTRALLDAGLTPAHIVEPAADSAQFDSESLWRQLQLQFPAQHAWQAAPVLVVRGDGGRDWLADTLRERGAEVSFVSAYRRSAPTWNAASHAVLAGALAQAQAHWWLFSSSESIGYLMAYLTHHAPDLSVASACALATHPRIAAAAQHAGFAVVRQCKPTLDDVVACLQSQPS